ncbi:MAG: hypothetical protein R3Y46_03520 [Opitutales bacterium]
MSELTKERPFIDTDVSSLDPRLLKQIEQAQLSIAKGNPDYAIDVCSGILAKNPACSAVRKLLHRARILKTGNGSGMKKFFGSFSAISFSAKGDIVKVLESAEKVLGSYADNKQVSQNAAKAAETAQYWPTAAVFWEDIIAFAPKDIPAYLALANALIKSLKADDAIKVGESILKFSPNNGEALGIMRAASVVKTMTEKWKENDDNASFRDKLKGADDAADREKETRLVNDDETLKAQCVKLAGGIEEDPENINLYIDLISNLKALKAYDQALEYLAKARQQPMGKADSSLEKLAADLNVLNMTAKIEYFQGELEAKPDDAGIIAAIKDLESQLHVFKLENAKKMVENYPNDFNLRYTLGELLLIEGKMDEAIAQFQISQRSPKVRSQSLLGLGKAFMIGKKFDMAIDQFKTAKEETKLMSDAKKEIIYQLGSAYEMMSKADEAFAEYKEIYAIDISYKDVSDKIDAYYAKK